MKHWDGVCAFDQLRKSYAEFERRVYKAFNAHKAPENRERDLHAIIGEGYAQTQIYRADLRAGLKAGTIFVGLMSKMFGRTLEREARGNAGTHFAFACQTAFKRDPRSASKRDPLFG